MKCGIMLKKKNKQWVWIAICKQTKQVISFVIGNRGLKEARELWRKTKNVCSPSRVCTDHWKSYEKVIPKEKHFQGKKETCLIESFNFIVRLRLKRFNRKSKCYSKTKKMIEASLLILFKNWNERMVKEYYAKTI
jgi:insertion element IS1 protein InsB